MVGRSRYPGFAGDLHGHIRYIRWAAVFGLGLFLSYEVDLLLRLAQKSGKSE